jgi:hypothetical protein
MLIYSYNLIILDFNKSGDKKNLLDDLDKISEDISGIQKGTITLFSFRSALLSSEITDILKLKNYKFILNEINDKNTKCNIFIPTFTDIINDNFTEEEQLEIIYKEIDTLTEEEKEKEVDRILSLKIISNFNRKLLLYLTKK